MTDSNPEPTAEPTTGPIIEIEPVIPAPDPGPATPTPDDNPDDGDPYVPPTPGDYPPDPPDMDG